MTSFWNWDGTTANNNGTADTTAGISIAENATPPSNVNNGMRGMMFRDKQVHDDDAGIIIGTGTANAHVVATKNVFAAPYLHGITFSYRPPATNTGAATINANTVGIKAIRKFNALGADVALTGGEMLGLKPYRVLYDTAANAAAGAFLLLNPEAIAGDQPYSPGTLYGLTLSNNTTDPTNDIDIAVGAARNSIDTANIDLLTALTKQLDVAWAVGTNAGMRATGVAIANGTYHIFLIKRPDTGVVDIAADTDVNGANIPANTNAAYTLRRRIGSIIRNAGVIYPFSQVGDEFLFTNGIVSDLATTTLGTTALLFAVSVPLGLKVTAIFSGTMANASENRQVLFTSPDELDQAPGNFGQAATRGTAGTGQLNTFGQIRLRTDTSRQLRVRSDQTATVVNVGTHGWVDTRGRT